MVSGAYFPYMLLSILMILSTTLESTWYILRSSTCHSIVNFYLSLFLLATHLLYGFISNTQYSNVPMRSFQNNKFAWRVPYSEFFTFVYMTGIPFSYLIHFPYFFGSNCVSSVASGPVIRTRIISSIFSCMNSPGMSHVSTSLSSLVLMAQDRHIDSVAMVGDMVSSLFKIYPLIYYIDAYVTLDPSAMLLL